VGAVALHQRRAHVAADLDLVLREIALVTTR
jgi:hypothetical protein